MWIVYAVLAALLWGLDYSVDERVLQKRVSVLTLLGLQMAAATAVILPLAFVRGAPRELKLAWEDRDLHWQIPLAVAVFTVGNLFIALSIQARNATVAALIEVAYPLAVVFFTWALFGEIHLTPGVVVGGSLILAGVMTIYFAG